MSGSKYNRIYKILHKNQQNNDSLTIWSYKLLIRLIKNKARIFVLLKWRTQEGVLKPNLQKEKRIIGQ